MATTPLEVEAIKEYLLSVGCKIEYPILVKAFKNHLYNPDPNVQGRVRNQFKDYVNRLATVSLENNMKFIILRPEFRPSNFSQSPPSQMQTTYQQNRSPPNTQFVVAKLISKDEQQAKPTALSGNQYQMQEQPRRPRPTASGSPLVQVSRQAQPQARMQYHDQTDYARVAQHHGQQQHFQHPNHQMSPPMYQHIPRQKQQRHQQLPSQQPMPQKNVNQSFPEQLPSVTTNSPSRLSRPPQYISEINANQQQKSLPPAPQFHSRTQSQPTQDHFEQQNRSPPYESANKHYQPQAALPQQQAGHSPLLALVNKDNNVVNTAHLKDDSAFLMPPPPPPPHSGKNLTSSPLRSQTADQMSSNGRQGTPILVRTSSMAGQQVPPPRPPPRRRQSTASLFKPSLTKPIEKISRDFIQDQARKSLSGRVREHATRFNSSASASDLSALMPKRNSSMKENRLSRESVFSGLASHLQRNGSQTRSRSSARGEDESDSSSLQPIDPLRRKWAIEACSCNYSNLLGLLREEPKLAACKDIVNGYTALHWAAKFGSLDIIKLIAGTHQVSANIKSSAGHTPLHVAYMFGRLEAAELLVQGYRASHDIRDHSGKKPQFYCRQISSLVGK